MMLLYFLSHLSSTREIHPLLFVCHKEYLSWIILGQWPLYDSFQWLMMGLHPCKELRQNCAMLKSLQPASPFYPNLFFSMPFRTLMKKLLLPECCSQVSFRCIILLLQPLHSFVLLQVVVWFCYS